MADAAARKAAPDQLDLIATLNARFAGTDPRDVLAAVIGEHLLGRLAVVSSFGADSVVLLDLVATVDPGLPVLFLDTGKHFPETLAYRDAVVAHLGLTDVRTLTPDAAVLAKRDGNGLRWSWDPDGCCELRKVIPLERALADFDASITGRKRFQAATRAELALFEPDGTRIKFNPLASWTSDDLARHLADRHLPPHPLVAEGYPSIGCAPCTSRVTTGEDPRAGRWKGWDKTECGIHVAGGSSDAAAAPLPPGYDPAF